MTAPTFAPVDDPTNDLLSLVADVESTAHREDVRIFLAACEADAATHGGLVSVNHVRARLAGRDINPRRFSALWSQTTGKGRPMVKTGQWETCTGSASGNDGRPYPIRRWVGAL
jgi:hypothetical protein